MCDFDLYQGSEHSQHRQKFPLAPSESLYHPAHFLEFCVSGVGMPGFSNSGDYFDAYPCCVYQQFNPSFLCSVPLCGCTQLFTCSLADGHLSCYKYSYSEHFCGGLDIGIRLFTPLKPRNGVTVSNGRYRFNFFILTAKLFSKVAVPFYVCANGEIVMVANI